VIPRIFVFCFFWLAPLYDAVMVESMVVRGRLFVSTFATAARAAPNTIL
jgi:hypothetical protein